MKKGIVVILAVAIIGALGLYGKGHSGSSQSAVGTSTNTKMSPISNSSDNQVESATTNSSSAYKDGTYTGDTEDTPYGPVQIAVVVSGGKISDINFLQMPSDRGHSAEVTYYSEPLLKQETLQKQGYHIDFVSGATTTSEAYEMSLQAALNQAA